MAAAATCERSSMTPDLQARAAGTADVAGDDRAAVSGRHDRATAMARFFTTAGAAALTVAAAAAAQGAVRVIGLSLW
jgi:hypothetical protein